MEVYICDLGHSYGSGFNQKVNRNQQIELITVDY